MGLRGIVHCCIAYVRTWSEFHCIFKVTDSFWEVFAINTNLQCNWNNTTLDLQQYFKLALPGRMQLGTAARVIPALLCTPSQSLYPVSCMTGSIMQQSTRDLKVTGATGHLPGLAFRTT